VTVTSERASDAPVLALRDVVRRYETGGETVVALDRVSVDAHPGTFVTVMGPSGSGKSTMLNLFGLLDSPDEGRVLLDGRDVTGLDDERRTAERRRSIGFVFQSFYLLPTLTAVENVELPTLFGPGRTRRDRARDLLDRVGLGDRLNHRPAELSGGQKQRVAIARALVNEPRLVLADEPTGNLDRETGATILDEFRRVADERDVAVVAVTHDPQLESYTDRTVELVDGQVR
jgi:ABC-type antimicrobial peptide transport system, ATPase component